MERKYRQRGYSDREAEDKKRARTERPDRPSEPRPKQDMLGPRTPRMIRTVHVLAAILSCIRVSSAFTSIRESSSNARSRSQSELRRRTRRTIAPSSSSA